MRDLVFNLLSLDNVEQMLKNVTKANASYFVRMR
jgi:hypothetical protein